VHAPNEDSFYDELERILDQLPKYNMKILLGDFNNKDVGRENTFKATIWKASLYEISTDIEVRVVKYATSKSLIFNSKMFPQHSIHKYTWSSPDEKTHNQIRHVLIHNRQYWNIVDVLSFRGADCKSARLSVSKRAAQEFDMERIP
jgi:hypothetical protein